MDARDAGHNRVPAPPDRITGMNMGSKLVLGGKTLPLPDHAERFGDGMESVTGPRALVFASSARWGAANRLNFASVGSHLRRVVPHTPHTVPPSADLFSSALQSHRLAFASLSALSAHVSTAAERAADAIARGGKIMFCGNGGSAGDAQHLAAELVGRLVRDRRALPGLALSTDSSALTCIANDFGYDEVFARQVEGLGRSDDVLIAISTSGNSPNVLRAAEMAKRLNIFCVGLLGHDGGKLKDRVDLPIVVASDETARIQEAHIFLGHVMCAQIEQRLGIGGWDG
jgi:D-sedoheptulose 7-phosphate isomerase